MPSVDQTYQSQNLNLTYFCIITFTNRLFKMLTKLHFLHSLVLYRVAFAFEDLYNIRDNSQDMIERGKVQYQLLKERGSLPQYGNCWKGAVEHINEGCRYLSEDTQSDIALHITNCFLEMSGHETYNCELDKKPNLRSICINNMSDRAFNVYTEFYTHTQNICWFLRGQIWHETISENTFKVGKQLEESSKNQEYLLKTQQESLELQQKMLKHGKFLEEVLEDLYVSVNAHREILNVMTKSLSRMQTWIIGEISWIDSIFFYVSTILIVFVLTSMKRTNTARLYLFLLMFANFIIERFLCSFITYIQDEPHVDVLYSYVYSCVWYSRYFFMCLSCAVFAYKVYCYQDLEEKNNALLRELSKKTENVLEKLENLKSKFNLLNSTDIQLENESKSIKENRYSYESNISNNSLNNKSFLSNSDIKENINLYSNILPRRHKHTLYEISNSRYNLRSRNGTPESGSN